MRTDRLVDHGRRGFPAVLVVAVAVTTAAAAGAPPAGSRAAQPGIISTFAGGVGGPAPAKRVAVGPCDVMAAAGNLYLSDQGSLRRISTTTDRLTTTAGVRVQGFSGDGSPAIAAQYKQELTKLSALLRTTKAVPFPKGKPKRVGS